MVLWEDYPSYSAEELIYLGFKYSPSAQLITSNRFIIEYNLAFAELFGYDLNELKGQSILRLYPTNLDFQKKGEVWGKALQKNPVYQDERFMLHKDQTVFWVNFTGRTLNQENPFELVSWTVTKISHNKAKILTKREQEIASYMANGLTSKKIANELGLSPRTVEIHRSKVMKKLDAKNIQELVSKFIQTS
ncbi:LuxR family transcriptional regulator [Pelistega indica]|uniref:LuxR family transcriptional regulator n=1 Tax=Pelistega indica TaxID=1414851 RepID=V8G7X0_9BURK|nr:MULTISPECIES: PAS and helix-turn-helix domain-containing protein [Pelistega]ETD72206.1 LuxR family transcriptional regulator [Pelistega indica]